MQWQKFKQLDYLVSQHKQAETCVVFFHGYGADANDLASLSQVYKLIEPTDWYFPRGVLQVPIGPMVMGRAWFELRVSDFENLNSNAIAEIPIQSQDQKTLGSIVQWLNHLGEQYKKVIFGGFSQGAILSSHCFYRLNFTPTALILLSGYIVAGEQFPTLPEALKIPFFQSHGEQDPVLNIKGARALFNKLQSLGLRGQWHGFRGGHEIPMDVIAESQIFVNSVLSSQE
jgi:phospholipase/carboxylesterase